MVSSNRDLRKRRRRREISPFGRIHVWRRGERGRLDLESADGIGRVLWKIGYGRGKRGTAGWGDRYTVDT